MMSKVYCILLVLAFFHLEAQAAGLYSLTNEPRNTAVPTSTETYQGRNTTPHVSAGVSSSITFSSRSTTTSMSSQQTLWTDAAVIRRDDPNQDWEWIPGATPSISPPDKPKETTDGGHGCEGSSNVDWEYISPTKTSSSEPTETHGGEQDPNDDWEYIG